MDYKIMQIPRLLLFVSLLALLPGCLTTSQTSSNLQTGDIDSALADAAQEAGPEFSLSLKEKLYKRDSTNPVKAQQYAAALRENGQAALAAQVLDHFIRNGNDDPALLTEYASTQLTLGSYKMAGDYAARALEKTPENGNALHVRAIALDTMGQHKEAENYFRTALKNWSGNQAPVLNNLGLNLAAQGNFTEALDTLHKAANLSPERADIQHNIKIVSALQSSQPSAVQ